MGTMARLALIRALMREREWFDDHRDTEMGSLSRAFTEAERRAFARAPIGGLVIASRRGTLGF